MIKEIRADYKKAAVLGDVLTPRVSVARIGSGQWSLRAVQEKSALWYG